MRSKMGAIWDVRTANQVVLRLDGGIALTMSASAGHDVSGTCVPHKRIMVSPMDQCCVLTSPCVRFD